MKQISNARLQWIDICKGIGIILVVASHALAPGRWYFHIFQVAMFILLSGFLYNDKYAFPIFLLKKIQTLYIPFVGWNFIVIVIREIYFQLTTAPEYHSSHLSSTLTHIKLLFLTFYKDGTYLGATWFLGSLFLISIAYKLVDMIIPKFAHRQILILLIFGAIACIGLNFILPYLQSRTLVLSFFFALGRFLRLHWEKLRRLTGFTMSILCLMLFMVLSNFTAPGLSNNEYKNPYIFMICAFLGSFAVICFASYMENSRISIWKPLCNFLSFIGKKSLDIMIWHQLTFKLVTVIHIINRGDVFSYEYFRNNVYYSYGIWTAIYIICGVGLSILFSSFLKIGPWGWLFKKIHLEN